MEKNKKIILWAVIDIVLLIGVIAVFVMVIRQAGSNDAGDDTVKTGITGTPTPGGTDKKNSPTPTLTVAAILTPTSAPATPTPTVTPEPTKAPIATVTPIPTLTPTPEPTITPVGTEDVVVDAYAAFKADPYSWCIKKNTTHTAPDDYGWGAALKFKNLNTYYVNKSISSDSPVMYLTFSCGYKAGYTSELLDALKENNTKAIFFIAKPFIEANPDIAKRMKEEGHLVGNYMVTQSKITDLTSEELINEIRECEEYFKAVTGYEMDKYCRPPQGYVSPRSLNVLNDLGYKTILWSFSYADGSATTADYVVEQFETYYHNGGIVLMNASIKANVDALPQVIKNMTEAGYSFGTLTELK